MSDSFSLSFSRELLATALTKWVSIVNHFILMFLHFSPFVRLFWSHIDFRRLLWIKFEKFGADLNFPTFSNSVLLGELVYSALRSMNMCYKILKFLCAYFRIRTELSNIQRVCLKFPIQENHWEFCFVFMRIMLSNSFFKGFVSFFKWKMLIGNVTVWNLSLTWYWFTSLRRFRV